MRRVSRVVVESRPETLELVHQQISFGYRLFEGGRSVILDWEIRSKSSMIRDFCSIGGARSRMFVGGVFV